MEGDAVGVFSADSAKAQECFSVETGRVQPSLAHTTSPPQQALPGYKQPSLKFRLSALPP